MSVHRLCRAIVGDLTLTAVTDVMVDGRQNEPTVHGPGKEGA